MLNGGFRADFNFRRGLALRIQQRRRVALVIPHAALIGADVIHQLDAFAVHFAGIHNAALLRRAGEGYAAQLKRRRILLFARIQHGIAQLGRRFSIKLGPSFCAAGGIGNQFLINLHAGDRLAVAIQRHANQAVRLLIAQTVHAVSHALFSHGRAADAQSQRQSQRKNHLFHDQSLLFFFSTFVLVRIITLLTAFGKHFPRIF